MDTIPGLDREITGCRNCGLCEHTNKVVPGEGPADARVMLIGQNPGANEDKTGRPFVGRSGRYLDRMLEANGLNRADFYITSVVKHATPGNRRPKAGEITACMPFLMRQIGVIKPAVVVLMGEVAKLTPRDGNIIYVETCHPAAAMRFYAMKRIFAADMRHLRKLVGRMEGET